MRAGDLAPLIGAEAPDLCALKQISRLGTGGCQGRYCAVQLAGAVTPRPPVRPVRIGDIVCWGDAMIKVIWFLRRAPHRTLAEFGEWWRNTHAPDIIRDRQRYLRRHVIDLRTEDDAGLAGRPAGAPEWDGNAGQWFATEADCNAV